MSLRLDIDRENFDIKFANLNADMHEFLPELVFATATILKEEMQGAVPVKTGNLRDSIRADIFPDSAEISTNSGYGLYVDQDTKPHIIRAKGKENDGADFLRFTLKGKLVFRKEVHHTGTTGQEFRLKTIKRSVPRIDDLFERDTRDLLNA